MKKFLLGLVFVVSVSAGGVLVAQNTLNKHDGDSGKMLLRDQISNVKTGADCKLPDGYCH